MNISVENFRSGHILSGYGYQYFVPNHINVGWAWNDPKINQLLESAAIRLGELNSFARLVPNVDLFVQLHVSKEAVVSSRIEGTRTGIDGAWLPEHAVSPEHRDDWREVNNYILAMNESIDQLQTLPVSSRLLKQAHKTLLRSVRGAHKLPGEFRTSQNWIGGSSPADAVFVPPSHEHVSELMGDLDKFLNNVNINLPTLVRIAIAHYQFETIHPFLDGNGRIGRLLITLFLVSEKMLDQPLLYLSTYFEKDKGLYYDNLTRVRTHNDMLQWLKYFLVGVEQTADEAVGTLKNILDLKDKVEVQIQNEFGRRAPTAALLLRHLFKQPILDVRDVTKVCGLQYGAANKLINSLCEREILTEVTGQSRNRLFAFQSYLEMFY